MKRSFIKYNLLLLSLKKQRLISDKVNFAGFQKKQIKKELYHNKFGFVIEPKATNYNSHVPSTLWIMKMRDQDPICFSKYQKKGTENRKKTETKEQKVSNLAQA